MSATNALASAPVRHVTPGQAKQLAIRMRDFSCKSTRAAVAQLVNERSIDHAGIQRILGKNEQLKAHLRSSLKNIFLELSSPS